MPIQVTEIHAKSVLTRTSGYLRGVTTHSLQPYRGCTYGNSLCGAGCYVQHNWFITRNRKWGSFLEVKVNAAQCYRKQYERECLWTQKINRPFSIFMSSSTDPFVPQEMKYRLTEKILTEMLQRPPEVLILQTHSHLAGSYLELYQRLDEVCDLRFQITIESDRDRLPGLPPPASSVDQRFRVAEQLTNAGLSVVITVSPLLPIREPRAFFTRISDCAKSVVIDHFIHGDGSAGGARTLKTSLPAAMAKVSPESAHLTYRDQMIAVAQSVMPGRVGVSSYGFAGRLHETGNDSRQPGEVA